MADLVSLEKVNAALRLDLQMVDDPSVEDEGEVERIEDIEAKIAQASDIVLDYVTHAEKDYWDEDTAPDRVQAATIMVVKCLLDDTEDAALILAGLTGMSPPDHKNPIVALLYRLRDPALA
jgi:hypothetical protein